MFAENPPFFHIVEVAWPEGISALWAFTLIPGNVVVNLPSTPSPQCYPWDYPWVPGVNAYVTSCDAAWHFVGGLTSTEPGLVVSGTPTLPSGTLPNTYVLGNNHGADFEDPNSSLIYEATSAPVSIMGNSLGPHGCYGSGTLEDLDGPHTVFGRPIFPEIIEVDNGIISTGGISATQDGEPLTREKTFIILVKGGVNILIGFE